MLRKLREHLLLWPRMGNTSSNKIKQTMPSERSNEQKIINQNNQSLMSNKSNDPSTTLSSSMSSSSTEEKSQQSEPVVLIVIAENKSVDKSSANLESNEDQGKTTTSYATYNFFYFYI